MFKIKNLRKERQNGWCYLICDFEVTEITSPFEEKNIWVAVEEKNSDMLSDKVYDPFVLVPLILGMHYKQDVKIEGNISPRFLHNIKHYLMKIFDNFSDFTSLVNFEVQGTSAIGGEGHLIGTGISCGVDSLVTIYDNFINTDDPNFKINSLFFVNCGTHGDYEDDKSRKIWMNRSRLNAEAAKELGLPMYLIDSNFHAFTHKWDEETIGYLAIYSCILSCQTSIKRYLASSNLSYDEVADNRKRSRDFDIAEYCESYMPHLISTERFELVIDGCQYTRQEKTERISDWSIARKYLNVCVNPSENAKNCSRCPKCMLTLIALDAMGKLNNFTEVFDLGTYYKHRESYKRYFVIKQSPVAISLLNYCEDKNIPLPSYTYAKFRTLLGKIKRIILR